MVEVINGILINEVETKNIMTKSSLPVGGYSVNPYVGCTHACKYCYPNPWKSMPGHEHCWTPGKSKSVRRKNKPWKRSKAGQRNKIKPDVGNNTYH